MKKKLSNSLFISVILTVVFFIIKLFNYNNSKDLLTPFYLGLIWFSFIFIVLTLLEKKFPKEVFNFNLFSKKKESNNNYFENRVQKVNDSVDLHPQINIETKIEANKTDMVNEDDLEEETTKKEKAKIKLNEKFIKKEVGQLEPEDFNFETKKIASAVRTMLNKK